MPHIWGPLTWGGGGNYTATINPIAAGDFPMHVLVNGAGPRTCRLPVLCWRLEDVTHMWRSRAFSANLASVPTLLLCPPHPAHTFSAPLPEPSVAIPTSCRRKSSEHQAT